MVTMATLVHLLCWMSAVIFTVDSQSPAFLKEPEDKIIISGQQVVMSCSVQNPLGQVQWTRDGFGLGTDRELIDYPRYSINGAEDLGEYNLFIANSQLEDDAEFQCQIGAADGFSGLMSKKAKLTVLWPPQTPVIEGSTEISSNTWQLKVTASVKSNITCRAQDGKPGANITWHVGGNPVTEEAMSTYLDVGQPNDDKQEDVTAFLEFTPSKTDQGKSVECYAMNDALLSPKMTRTYLEVMYVPEITMMVEPSRKVQQGGKQAFMCEGNANPSTITWKWYIDDVELEGETAHTLILHNVQRDKHGKVLACEGTNEVGSIRRTYTLTVEFGPYFVGEATHVAINRGEDAELYCNVQGNPLPAILWTRRNSPRMLGRSDRLRISDVTEQDFGEYLCTAMVTGFSEVQRSIYLLQKGAPSVRSEQEQSAVYNDDAELICEVKSVPGPTLLQWSRDGTVLDFPNMMRHSVVEVDLVDGKRSTINIRQVQDTDFGLYNCTVVNEYGADTMTIELVRKETIAAWVIALGVILGFLFVVGIAVALFIFYKKKRGGSEYGSDSSENTLQKKDTNDKKEDIVPVYKDTIYGGPIDGWANGPNKPSPEYDELHNYAKQPNQGPDYIDGGYGGYNTRNPDPYGTFPGPANKIYDTRYAASDYGPLSNFSDYGTYGRARPPPPHEPEANYAASDYGVPPVHRPHHLQQHNHQPHQHHPIRPASNRYTPTPTFNQPPPQQPQHNTLYPPPPDSRLATNV